MPLPPEATGHQIAGVAPRALRLVDRVPDLDVDELVTRLVPPRRFASVRVETYVPSPEHQSQAVALAAMERFAADLIERERPAGRRFAWRRGDVAQEGAAARYLDGGYGGRARVEADALDDSTLEQLVAEMPGPIAVDDFDALLVHLRRVHPVRFGALLDGLDAVVVRGLHPIADQGNALLFCALVDELYDAEVKFAVSGCGVGELFPESYRQGGYRKKYGRCESRLAAMLAELEGE